MFGSRMAHAFLPRYLSTTEILKLCLVLGVTSKSVSRTASRPWTSQLTRCRLGPFNLSRAPAHCSALPNFRTTYGCFTSYLAGLLKGRPRGALFEDDAPLDTPGTQPDSLETLTEITQDTQPEEQIKIRRISHVATSRAALAAAPGEEL